MTDDLSVTILMLKPMTSDRSLELDGLRDAGVKIESVLPRIRVVTGTVDPSRLGALRALPEVKSVEEDCAFRV